MNSSIFKEEYQKLNKAQKEAVDTINGPVMVIAGPGTGKTQILALRIANILNKTDVQADGILCLTFTNSAVRAMRERLHALIGNDANKINILTFHKFSASIINEFYSALDFLSSPRILEDAESVSICDQILQENDWEHIKPRGDTGRYFKELKSLVSLLKKERLSPEEFLQEIESEILFIQQNPDNLSSRGESKGQIKKEFLSKIESLERTKEIVIFYRLYEEKKKENNFMDHDDTLKYALGIILNSEEAKAKIQQNYLYILIDEHQDSSGIQNELLKAIWQEVEKPDIFAVGDDRQLIYAFGGAKISYFEEFQEAFGKARVIFLTDNYRSTQKILETADSLLSSSFSDKKLKATLKENHNLNLIECDYPRDEIIACGLEIQEKIKNSKIDLNDCAILVPKNRQIISALRILKDLGIKVASGQSLSLFETAEFEMMLRILKICSNSQDSISLSESILDPLSEIPILNAHEFLFSFRGKEMNLNSLLNVPENLFGKNKEIKIWGIKLKNIIEAQAGLDIYSLIQVIGDEILLKNARDHEELVRRVEIIRSFLHLSLSFIEKNKSSLNNFIYFIERLQNYGENIPLAIFKNDQGVKVMTLHGSKGLEFDFVWIAHMDENSLMKGKKRIFRLPESIANKIEIKDELGARRELYVALTRAKRFCYISHSRFSYSGQNQELAKIISDLDSLNIFDKSSFSETENKILEKDPKIYVLSKKEEKENNNILEKLKETVSKEYLDIAVSVSMLNNFFECPWRWYFRNLLKLPEAKSENLEFGNNVHQALDKALKSKKILSSQEIEKLVFGDTKALAIVSNWIKNRLPTIAEKRENEKSISIKDKDFSSLNIYGKLDLIEELDSNNLRVIDFKTGHPRKKSEIEKIDTEGRMSDYMRQLVMYAYLLKESRKKNLSNIELVLEFLEAKNSKDSFYQTLIDSEKIALLRKDIKDYDTLVKNGLWTERNCSFKSFGKIGSECEYCKMARIYKK